MSDVLRWHGAWAGSAVAAGALVAAAYAGRGGVSAGLILAFGGVPGLAGLTLQRFDGRRARTVVLLVWGCVAAIACAAAGGLSGPLAAWCLAPLAAATVFGGPGRLAQGAAISLFAVAVTGLAQLAGITPPAVGGAPGLWLALAGLALLGVGFGGGLALDARREGRRETAARAAEAALSRTLSGQAYLILDLGPSGEVAAAYGQQPEGLGQGRLNGVNLCDLATLNRRSALRNVLRDAAVAGQAEADFTPVRAPERICHIAVRRAEIGFVAVIRDASRDRWREAELEAARVEAESLNAGKSRFLANMSHELRTPLNAVMGFSDVMKAKLFGELPPRYAEYADMIHESGRHLLDLINDVLDMSKIEAERYQLTLDDFDARDAVSAALRLVRLQADNAGVSLRGVLPPEALEVAADRRALKQIVLNLVSNALKFTPRGGAITVSAQRRGATLELVVSDTGVGIAPEDLERLGRPYEQAGDAVQRSRGTGLGLSLVRAFAELHGGAMSIESELGEGTSVTVRLPVMRGPEGDEPPGAKIIAFNAERR